MTLGSISVAPTRLIEAGGRTFQDFGAGRIVEQIVVFSYLQDAVNFLIDEAEELGLSKASVCIAARQLELFGLNKRHWKQGDHQAY